MLIWVGQICLVTEPWDTEAVKEHQVGSSREHHSPLSCRAIATSFKAPASARRLSQVRFFEPEESTTTNPIRRTMLIVANTVSKLKDKVIERGYSVVKLRDVFSSG